ncbi:ras-related protein Rab-13 isoform X1 [Lingula anatina]|uniref:Ras-related protein Rab-13 isoform X1 n=1 Tax=Lingula anatina TaxID=7574 RepID=A0A1S3I4A6_LINAN|nr:ras-related protein Rab-13 isoform X1 [Lingula anatina]XP_013393064.1 ras-related protein Rab-13 isoform X1 [Lingula anatina]|eukprot:XP_013393063.1 ras-related protein Rab-13 isoform X1 [Lingula anatina]
MAGKEFDVKYKVLLIGNSGVGKTALIRALTQEEFSMEMLPTIGIDFVKKIFHVDGANVQLEIWDTAGQERFRTITKFQYRGTKGILLVYDVTDVSSFNNLTYWLQSIDEEIRPDHPTESIPVYIIGNKCDLEQQRQISKRDGKKKAQETLVRGFMETSAKNNINIQEAFYELAHALLDTYNPKLMTSYLNPVDRKEKKGSKQRISQLTSSSSEYDQTSSRSKKIKLKKKDKPRSSCCHRS